MSNDRSTGDTVLPHLISGQFIAKNPALFDSPFLKKHPGALAQYSVKKASAVFRSDGL
jgi:hypothetical protein